jgi:fructosamine-3-kinase
MFTSSIQKYLNQLLVDHLGIQISTLQYRSIGGGCINETYEVQIDSNTKFFLKLNSVAKYPALFKKEKNGLEFLAKQKIIRSPAVIAFGEFNDHQMLLLEWIESGLRTERFWKDFGEQLAALHQQTWVNKNNETLFGLDEDNYIGSLHQENAQEKSWIEFFIHWRLQPQIKIAKDNRLLHARHLAAFDKLHLKLTDIFNTEESALLHGDLWSGNFMCHQNSEPVLIDPAIYFGNRNMDLAMTTLFGGFDKLFYESYNYHFPFAGNYHEQWEVCNLYPLLIHLNLFGSGYLGQIERILEKFK